MFRASLFALAISNLSLLSAQVDGTVSASENYQTYCIQNNPTGFGDATNGSVIEAQSGSELDGAYAKVANGVLYIMLTGNLENFSTGTSNRIELFIDAKTGGENTITNQNPIVTEFEDVNKMAGIKFDTDFSADYWFTLAPSYQNTKHRVAMYYAEMGDPNGLVDIPLPDVDLNSTGGPYNFTWANGALGWNNSNTAGVSPTAVGNAASVTTGFEFAIPLSKIGNPTSNIKICAFINSAAHDYVSNQVLCGLGGTAANLQSPVVGNPNYLAGVDFSSIAGDQYFVINLTSAVETPFEAGVMNVSPTLVENTFDVRLVAGTHLAQTTHIDIFSLDGKKVSTHVFGTNIGENVFSISTENLPSGMYFVKVKNGNFFGSEKIVVNN